ncbi:MAG: hypothetical protein IT245_01200 [Bacteroidia bacterium]|nr:hypothetical protein [Bacteroidia bacterium]
MKKIVLLALLSISINAFSYITIIQNTEQVGSGGWLRVTENFSTDGPGNCIFELNCTDPGRMNCSFTVLDPNNTPGCVTLLVNNGGTGSGNAFNDVCDLVNIQIASGNVSGTIQPGNIAVIHNGTNESAVITYVTSINTSTNTRQTEIKVYAYSEAQSLGII